MRLLTWNAQNEFVLTDDLEEHVPRYAILSHTWGLDGDEVTFNDIQNGYGQNKIGYKKIEFCGEQAKRDDIDHFWVDTCCINKTSESELSQAIRSMFLWYANAARCYVYLSDVSTHSYDGNEVAQNERAEVAHNYSDESFRNSKWFTRGWTLQELLAPSIVQFFSQQGTYLGDKTSLAQQIHEITDIPSMALQGTDVDQFSVDERIRWTKQRRTKKVEDGAYCLLGIFKVHMPLMYGERENAWLRLRKEINERWGTNVAADLSDEYEARTPASRRSPAPVDVSEVRHTTPVQMKSLQLWEHQTMDRSVQASRLERSGLSSGWSNNSMIGSPWQSTVVSESFRPPKRFSQTTPVSVTPDSDLLQSLVFDRIDFRVNNVKRPLPSTCQWLFRHQSFQMWWNDVGVDQHNGFLWIRGKPGCGKSTLMKATLEWIRKQKGKEYVGRTIVPYFFNARASASLEKSSLGLYRTLVRHLVSSYPVLRNLFISRFAHKDPFAEDDGWTAEELQGFLEDSVESGEPFELYLLIDALDEAEYEDDVRRMIRFLVQLSDRTVSSDGSCKLRICLSSRHYPHVKIGKGLSVVVEAQHEHGQDIEKYITEELTCDEGPEKGELRRSISGKSARIFLWVVLVVRILNQLDDRGASLSDMKARLKTIPHDLNQLFTEILTKNEHGLETTILLFRWMAFRRRPLEPAELYMAMEYSKSPSDENWTLAAEISVPTPDRLAKLILDNSRGLVEITEAGSSQVSVVQFIHETVPEFLFTENALASILPSLADNLVGVSHEILRIACLRRLSTVQIQKEYEQFLELSRDSKVSLNNLRRQMTSSAPFLDYSALHLYQHAEKAQSHGVPQQKFLMSQMNPKGLVTDQHRRWLNLLKGFDPKDLIDNPLIFFLVESQCSSLLSAILSMSPNNHVDATDTQHVYILHKASHLGHDQAVQILLDNGADVNSQGGLYGTALKAASMRGYEKIVRLLLDRGAAIDAQGGTYGSALQVAAKAGFDRVVQMLLDGGADVNIGGGHYGTALKAASSRGHEKVVRMLLEGSSNIDINANEGGYGTALEAASKAGHEQVVQILLDKGADANISGGQYGTALRAASTRDHRKVVHALLESSIGIDLNATEGSFGTALEAASSNGHVEVVQMLLDKGANANVDSKTGGPLLAAAIKGHSVIIQKLLEAGAELKSELTSWNIPLQAAAANGHVVAVSGLLDWIDGPTREGQNPYEAHCVSALYHASLEGHEVIVDMLLRRGTDINAIGGTYGAALQAASVFGYEEVVLLLLDKGADINITEGRFGTALQAALVGRQRRTVQLLLDKGADIRARGGYHGAVLPTAAASGVIETVQLLLDRGADVNESGGNAGTALKMAVKRGFDDIAQLLRDNGADETV